ncbi:M23 family metallopeptidase [Acaryochloris sp. CCMEE 5410]|uniref:M23 family metallopeptidase n=1 Tax=Acaryochloris sp. CCMEE 5410 TaxID=310037 RepID=UPI0021D31D9B|nr:M23 family metallopeptidase [Acaryochloris sp. CCMEE 5410]
MPQGTYLFTDYFAHFHRRRGRPHLGVDLGAAKGTPVLSVEAGTIDHVGWDPDGYGNFIVVGHPNGTGTLYAHLSEVNVRPGQSVDNADQIGRVGNTGRSRGDHLHFEFFEGYTQGNHRSGYPVDPENISISGENDE